MKRRAIVITVLSVAITLVGCNQKPMAINSPNQKGGMPMAKPELSCTLSPQELQARRAELIPGLFKRAERVDDIANGVQFQFAHQPGLIRELADIVEREQDCCSFLRFELSAEAGAGAVVLKVTGPEGTARMLRSL